tara:strand:- start:350 stop:634 length:285 start_codon:yes stop_codon:yes gene_type:complete
MIIFTVCTQNGDSEYREWSFTDQITKEDYESGKATDVDLLYDFCGTEFTDEHLFEKGKYDSANNYKYWNDTSLVWIETVKEINKEDLATIRKYV